MKIKPVHFNHMKQEIDKVLIKFPDIAFEYEIGNFFRSESVKNLQMRFCFDVLSAAGLDTWVSSTLYPYMNDDHLFTALKRICPTVERKY